MIFESILTEAAEKARAQEARTLAIENQRRQELHEMAREVDLAMDRRRQRKNRALTWDYFRPLIEKMKLAGASDVEIAEELCQQGFSTSRREVYKYTANNGLRTKSQKTLRPSKMDPHIDLVKEMHEAKKSLTQISAALRNRGVDITHGSVANFIKSRNL